MMYNRANWIFIFLWAVFLPACRQETTMTLRTKEGDTTTLKQYVISGQDTILHGISAAFTASGDTLSKKLYERGHLIGDWKHVHETGTIIHRDVKQNTTAIVRKAADGVRIEKVMRGDSVLTWTFFDESGQAFSRKKWHELHARNYYNEYLKYLNFKASISKHFQMRILSIPHAARPGLIDITKDEEVEMRLFDYREDKFKYTHARERSKNKWVKYITQLRRLSKPASPELQRTVTDFTIRQHPPFTFNISCYDSCDIHFVVLDSGAKTLFFVTAPGLAPPIVSEIQIKTGYRDEAAKIDIKLERWKAVKKQQFFFEEILKLPYQAEYH